jgi:hypothetical protein
MLHKGPHSSQGRSFQLRFLIGIKGETRQSCATVPSVVMDFHQ